MWKAGRFWICPVLRRPVRAPPAAGAAKWARGHTMGATSKVGGGLATHGSGSNREATCRKNSTTRMHWLIQRRPFQKLDDAHALFNTTPAISKAKPIVDFSANAPPPPPSVGTAIPLSIEMHAVVLSLSFEMRAVANVKTKRPTYTLQRLCRGNVPPRNYRTQDVGNASCLPRKVPPDPT